MRVIIEWEGTVADVRRGYHRAHQLAATKVGWSSLDDNTFWRLLRKGGREANVLPGARPVKLKQYLEEFAAACESDEVLECFSCESETVSAMKSIGEHCAVVVLTLGTCLDYCRRWCERAGLSRLIEQTQHLSNDPRRRPTELRALAANDPRTVVVAASDSVIRAASAAELFAVGVSSGACLAARLHQAGADLVCDSLAGFEGALAGGASELVRRGLLPPSYE